MRSLRQTLVTLYAGVGGLLLFKALFSLRNAAQMAEGAPYTPMRVLAAAFLPITAALFLLAAISFWRKWRSARLLCLLIGVVNLCIPLLLVAILWHEGDHQIFGMPAATALLPVLGVLSIVAFWGWDPSANDGDAISVAPRRGDGTLSFLNHTYYIIHLMAFMGLWSAWEQWARRHDLPLLPFWPTLLQIVAIEILAVALHECGHALCGIALGYKLRSFQAGPFQLLRFEGRWKFTFNPLALLAVGGATGVVPTTLDEPRGRELAMIAAGPLASLVTGTVGLWVALHAPDSRWENLGFLIGMFGSLSLLIAVMNLMPLRAGSGYSDGARIAQLLRGGVWAELHQVFRIAAATTITPLRPRDYDIGALHRVIDAELVTGPPEFLLHLLAHSYYVDCGRRSDADDQMREADKVFEKYQSQIRAELLPSFVMNEALVRRDPARARLWWDRMEGKKPKLITADYWMARSALRWSEGDRAEAEAAWVKADEYLGRMPAAGTYVFDRDVLAQLKKTISTESVAEELASV